MTEDTAADYSAGAPEAGGRPWLAWALMVAGDGFAVWRGYLAAMWYQQWQRDRIFDPGVADAAWNQTQREAVLAVCGLAVAAVGVLLFMRAQRARRRAQASDDAS